MWTHKEVDSAPHPVICLVLQIGDAEKFLQALGLKSLNLLLSQQEGPCLIATEQGVGDKRLAQFELTCKTDCLASPDLV